MYNTFNGWKLELATHQEEAAKANNIRTNLQKLFQ